MAETSFHRLQHVAWMHKTNLGIALPFAKTR